MTRSTSSLIVPWPDLIAQFVSVVGAKNALTCEADQLPYLTEWRDRYHGKTPVVLKPQSSHEVSAILKLANAHRVGVVAQGGNTGLVGGQIPRPDAADIVVSVERMTALRAIDAGSRTLTAEAGMTVAGAQAAADDAGLLFPLSMASEGSASIGGTLATNAGGLNVLAYGTARQLTLGIEAVLADGSIWNGLGALKKDNTGYDLKDLMVGSEGTLGIITAATLKLYPRPVGQATVLCGLKSLDDVAHLFQCAETLGGPSLTAFEFMSETAVSFAVRHVDHVEAVLKERWPWVVLFEVSSAIGDPQAEDLAASILTAASTRNLISESAFAASLTQRQAFWRLRESISEAQKFEGGSIKHDISVAPGRLPAFVTAANALIETVCPGARPCPFGHFGDGNVHYNISQPAGGDKAEFLARWDDVQSAVHDLVTQFDGSISAEHGIGVMKREALKRHKDPAALAMMHAIKAALDPNGILNPGKLL